MVFACLGLDLGISEDEAVGILNIVSQRVGAERTGGSHRAIVSGMNIW